MIMNFRSLAAGLLLLSSAIAARGDVLFSDNFDGASTPLHGTTPDTTLAGDGNWWDFGTWSMDEPRCFWQIQRTEEATDEL